MAERYNVRNVAQKEVYDSYMGILRISPNLTYGVEEDDATDLLNTLVDFRNVYEDEQKQKQIKVQLSDSDGNMLPVYFIPRAFNTEVTLRENGNNYKSYENIINICTWSDNTVFVSNKLDIRSTLSLKIKDTISQNNISLITIVTGGQKNTIQNTPQANAILQYPIENPNDDYFFNKDNNKYPINNTIDQFLFSTEDERPRHEQMESNLLNQKLDWYKNVITEEIKRTGEDPQVKVGDKYVNTFNVHNEDVPVFYTRDYILGHYEGHTVKGVTQFGTVKEQWIDSQSKAYDVSLSENSILTRLSWIRIDKLIWDAIDEIISGKIRHSGSGRYTDMGAQTHSGTKIEKELFGIGLNEEGDTELNTEYSVGSNSYTKTAPILGQGVQPGLIMYHAMPLHRYWFHRCRQIVYNMGRYNVLSGKEWSDYVGITKEVNDLKTYNDENLITAASRASITPHHSLVKDFLLCNGQTVNFENYPNISLTNANLLVNDEQGKEAEVDKKLGIFPNRTSGIPQWETGTYGAIRGSISDDKGEHIKTPNLFAFNEAYPRFIRGLSWETDESWDSDYESGREYNLPTNSLDDYTATLTSPSKNRIHSSRYKLREDKKGLEEEDFSYVENSPDIWNNQGLNIKKPLTNVSLHHHNYDFAAKSKNHFHYLFSSSSGGVSNKGYKGHKFEELAAFYAYGTYAGVTFRVASNLGTYYYNGNEHNSDDYNYGDTYCLALTSNYINNKNYINIDGDEVENDLSNQWNTYCLRPTKDDTFHDFTPVGNAGLILWNGDVYNTDNNDTYKGTSKEIEDSINNVYYITNYPLDLKDTNVDNYITEINYLNQKVENFKTGNATEDRTNRFKRKQQVIKLNEAEGRIPISFHGQAKYRLEEGHMIERERSWGSKLFKGDDYDTEPITVYKNRIGNYILKGVNMSIEDTSTWGWSCLTSLPFEYPEFLGVGDLDNLTDESFNKSVNLEFKTSEPAKYYINHNVTDRWKKVQPEEKVQVIKYGGVEVKCDTQSPAPAHLYLLPLIRL